MHPPPAVPGCRTPDDVAAYLERLRSAAGDVPFRELTTKVNAIRLARNVRQTARQTVNDCFRRGRSRLDRDLVLDIARALGLDDAGLLRLDQECQVADGRRPVASRADVSGAIPLGRKQFLGRDAVIDDALAASDAAWAAGRPPVVVFTGLAGIGKTELAMQLAQRLLVRDPTLSRQFFVDLHGFDPDIDSTPPAEVLAALLKLLGVRDPAIVNMSDEGQRRERLRQQLSEQRAVIVFDNVADAEQLARLVPATPHCAVIATTQQRLDGGVEVGPLAYHDCVDLLARFDSADRLRAEPGVAVRLINDLCGRRPFDLIALGAQLSDPAEAAWSLADHEERLRRFRLDEASHRILAGSCHGLAREVRRTFRLLGLYPGFEFSAYDVAVLSDVAVEVAHGHLQVLYDRHLLLRRKAHRFRLHAVASAYARRLLDREEATRSQRAALNRLQTATTYRVSQ
ncbi:MAG TPA: NB-ARC domain-containing protein [Stackebrandtia sp.]|uniref:NB-ARC domain-containing protein n=1 Tax=Stackebrandtia sp. TaxID=2023065 RepID=UPI002D22D056|nr:NB-ARC domain-containing protein [Stackebrandtia sp.]HZE38476.1 NB-ARC domain-containing protein [Stackebrandtia sp.]